MTHEVESHKSRMSKWLQSAHHPLHNISQGVLWAKMNEELPRIERTKKKIEFLMDSMKSSFYETPHQYKTRMNLEKLHHSIGLYKVPSFADDNSYLWSRPDKDHDNTFHVGSVWFDYLGNPSIRLTGGYVVVMLSDEGVEYLNGIANMVSSDSRYTIL